MRLLSSSKKRSSVVVATSDIAFLLLIFLVVAASLNYSPEIQPPESPYVGKLDSNADKIIIEVTPDGIISVAGEVIDKQQLYNVFSTFDIEDVVEIFADRSVPFSEISDILLDLQDNQKYKVFLLLESEKE